MKCPLLWKAQYGVLLICTTNNIVNKETAILRMPCSTDGFHVSYTGYTQANHTSVMQPSNPLHSVPAVRPATSRCLSFTVHGPHPVCRPPPAPSPLSKSPSPHNIYTIIWKWQFFENSPWLSDIKSDLSSAECLAGELLQTAEQCGGRGINASLGHAAVQERGSPLFSPSSNYF